MKKVPQTRSTYVAAMVASLDAHYPTERLAACDALLDCTRYFDAAVLAYVGATLLEVVKGKDQLGFDERERALALLARLVNTTGW